MDTVLLVPTFMDRLLGEKVRLGSTFLFIIVTPLLAALSHSVTTFPLSIAWISYQVVPLLSLAPRVLYAVCPWSK